MTTRPSAKRRLDMEQRRLDILRLADGSLTSAEVADRAGISRSAMWNTLGKMPGHTARFKPSPKGGWGRKRELLAAGIVDLDSCSAAVRCGVCDRCRAIDAKASANAGPRCKCGLILPCGSCVGRAEDYIRSGQESGGTF